MRSQEEIKRICSEFLIYGDFLVATPFGRGHINDTYQLAYDQGGVIIHYTLQKINKNVFPKPEEVMENIKRVTEHLASKIVCKSNVRTKRALKLVDSKNGHSYVIDEKGDYWRVYIFIASARSFDVLENPNQAYEIAKSFGGFQNDLVDLQGGRLFETIKDFHDTPKRLDALITAAREDKCGRVKDVEKEIDFAVSRSEDTSRLIKLCESGDIPERITHNDTKSNNILIDHHSGKGVCIIDLDTVMPGLSLYDFGDMIRTAVNPMAEDETNIHNLEMRFDMYEAAYKGFMDSAKNFLTPAEVENMPFSGKLITLEIGIRFLTDYLNGDVYFKTTHKTHNIERCRNQFKLVSSLEKNMDKMKSLLLQK